MDGCLPASTGPLVWQASTIVAWNLFKHFYPYWDQVPAKWDDELAAALQRAALAPDDRAYHQELRHLLAILRDGHAWVGYTPPHLTELPLDWEWVEGQLVVTAVDQGAGEIVPGTIVEAIDGAPVKESLDKEISLISGSPQWQQEYALERLRESESGAVAAALTLRAADGTLSTALVHFDAIQWQRFAGSRPPVVEQIRPGVLYVDVTRLDHERFTAQAERIAKASSLIFDLRGYPAGEDAFLNHLSDRLMLSAKMELPEYVAPDGLVDHWNDGGWSLQPTLPRYTKNVVFLTDASAISYAESILGTVKGNRLATIIGEPTAGTNGNITRFILPGGYVVSWTAMRVTNQDGSPHHLVGVLPDVLVKRTVAGIREGRDEVLDAGVSYVSSRMGE